MAEHGTLASVICRTQWIAMRFSEAAKEEKERKGKENPLDSQGWYSVGPKIRHPFIPLKSCGLRID
jgi:hypothetical protein